MRCLIPTKLIVAGFVVSLAFVSSIPIHAEEPGSTNTESSTDVLAQFKAEQKAVDDAYASYEIGDYKSALPQFEALAKKGNRNAYGVLGDIFLYGRGAKQNFTEALKWYRLAATKGSNYAQTKLANMIRCADGTVRNDAEAFKLYQQASESGSVAALINLASAYADGEGTAQNRKAAFTRYVEVYSSGKYARARKNEEVVLYLCRGVNEGNSERIIQSYRDGANKGSVSDQFEMAFSHFYEVDAARNFEEADKWFELATGNDPDLQYRIGDLYINSYKVPDDYQRAAKWYRLAAVQGHKLARYELAALILTGKDTGFDKAEAEKWASFTDMEERLKIAETLYDRGHKKEAFDLFLLAANQGNPVAQFRVGKYYLNRQIGLDDDREALRWFKMAVEQGSRDAMNDLGYMHYYGIGVSKNDAEAVKLIYLAADKGNKDAMKNMSAVYKDGIGGMPKDEAESAKWRDKWNAAKEAEWEKMKAKELASS